METSIKKPLLTEKTLKLASLGWYTFAVDISADKAMIQRDIAERYKVDVMEIRSVTVHGKSRRTGKKLITKRTSNWKKAVVHLKEGQTIDAFQVTGEGK